MRFFSKSESQFQEPTRQFTLTTLIARYQNSILKKIMLRYRPLQWLIQRMQGYLQKFSTKYGQSIMLSPKTAGRSKYIQTSDDTIHLHNFIATQSSLYSFINKISVWYDLTWYLLQEDLLGQERLTSGSHRGWLIHSVRPECLRWFAAILFIIGFRISKHLRLQIYQCWHSTPRETLCSRSAQNWSLSFCWS
jgi:hypothetical protein